MPTAAQTIRPTGDGEPTADEKKRFDSCTRICYNDDSHRTRSQAICGRFVCAGIRCRTEADAAHSAQRGKNLKGLAAVESKYSILEAARELGRSKSTLKYQVKKLPPETISKDDAGRIWISADGLELLRGYSKIEPVENQSLTGRKVDENSIRPDENAPLTGRKPDESTDSTRQTEAFDQTKADVRPVEKSDSTTQTAQLEALRAQLERLRNDLDICREQRDKEEKRAAVAAAERDAERRRADAAELREQQHAQTVSDLTAALQSEQQHAAELTALLQTAHEQLTAALALNAGQIQLQMQQSEPAAVTAEPADDQPGDTRSPSEARDTAEDQQTTGDDQSTGKRRGFFAKLFGKR